MSASAVVLPAGRTLDALRAAAAGCTACDLYREATQTVFGEGPAHARAMFVGEQPGDQEDRQGRPFVGPAGALLRASLAEAGIDPDDAYITNSVKHFTFVWRGKRRIHAKPRRIEMRACEPWLTAEISAIRPAVVVALGATAALALLGPAFRLTEQRGTTITSSPHAPAVIATIHPSAILRADDASRDVMRAGFVRDLRVVAAAIDAVPR